MPLALALLAIDVSLGADVQAGKPPELAIYPGFDQSELGMSLDAVTKAAEKCLALSPPPKSPQLLPTDIGYLEATMIGGEPVQLESVSLDVGCRAWPVTRCMLLHARSEAHPELAYTTLQCTGSFQRSSDTFVVTAISDLRNAERNPERAMRRSTISYSTTSFPGIAISAAGGRRADGRLVQMPVISQLDDYGAPTEPAVGVVSLPQLQTWVRQVHDAACALMSVSSCGGPPVDAHPTAAD